MEILVWDDSVELAQVFDVPVIGLTEIIRPSPRAIDSVQPGEVQDTRKEFIGQFATGQVLTMILLSVGEQVFEMVWASATQGFASIPEYSRSSLRVTLDYGLLAPHLRNRFPLKQLALIKRDSDPEEYLKMITDRDYRS
jgi:hypothetical protein